MPERELSGNNISILNNINILKPFIKKKKKEKHRRKMVLTEDKAVIWRNSIF